MDENPYESRQDVQDEPKTSDYEINWRAPTPVYEFGPLIGCGVGCLLGPVILGIASGLSLLSRGGELLTGIVALSAGPIVGLIIGVCIRESCRTNSD